MKSKDLLVGRGGPEGAPMGLHSKDCIAMYSNDLLVGRGGPEGAPMGLHSKDCIAKIA